MRSSVLALALLESAQAFNGIAAMKASRSNVQMFSEGDLGVLPPLGVYDPLGLIDSRDMGRYQTMEIKHGRAAMLGFLHVVVVEAGIKIPTEGWLQTRWRATRAPTRSRTSARRPAATTTT